MSKRVRQEAKRAEPPDMQAENRRSDGTFGPGNKVGTRSTFRPGKSGNPRGRPKSALLSNVYRRMLGEVCPDDEKKRTWAEVIAERTLYAAAGGDIKAVKEIADRVEGKAQQRVTLSYEMRELYERTIQEIMEASGCTREEAIRTLAIYKPDAVSLLVH